MEDLPAVHAYWLGEDERLVSFVRSLVGADLECEVVPSWKGRPYKIWQIIVHIVNHRADHGNEIGWQLSRLGHSPGELGFMRYVDLQRTGSA